MDKDKNSDFSHSLSVLNPASCTPEGEDTETDSASESYSGRYSHPPRTSSVITTC